MAAIYRLGRMREFFRYCRLQNFPAASRVNACYNLPLNVQFLRDKNLSKARYFFTCPTFRNFVVLALFVFVLFARVDTAPAVVLYRSGEANYSTPTGSMYGGSGWQWTGTFGSYATGTAIAPQYFITANHYAGASSDVFSFLDSSVSNSAYTIDKSYGNDGSVQIGGTDLRIWKISDGQSFGSNYAPLYSGNAEANKPMVVIGRGVQRGAEVTVGGELKGWQFGDFKTGNPASWGSNVVSGVTPGGSDVGDLIYYYFDQNGTPEEATVAGGDSGGPVFIKDTDDQWKLAGINYGVESPFRTVADGSDANGTFNAAIFDKGGLYEQDENKVWQLQPDGANNSPAYGASTRISTNYSAILADVPEPASISLILIVGSALLSRTRNRRATV